MILKVPYKGEFLEILIDDEDYDMLKPYKWTGQVFQRDGYRLTYVSAPISGKRQQLHRFILSARRGLVVDHKNGNTLDNRKANLRLATFTQNMQNRAKSFNVRGKYKGVQSSGSYSWSASVTLDGITWVARGFTSEDDAAIAYNNMAQKAFGEFASLNKIEKNMLA